jgi:hypothetical protein
MGYSAQMSKLNAEHYAWIRGLITPYAADAGIGPEFDLYRISSTGPPMGLVTFTVGDASGCIDVTFRSQDIE